METEEWRAVPEYECRVSSLGRIEGKTRVLNGWMDSDDYWRVNVRFRGRWKQTPVHLLVALAFIGPRPTSKHEVAHGNGDKDVNEPWNLRWATRKENSDDRYLHGTMFAGETAPSAKLTVAAVRDIRARYRPRGSRRPCTQTALAAKHGVSRYAVACVLLGRTWKSVGPHDPRREA